MQAVGFPENKHQRIAALHALQVLDTPADEAFDRITQFVCDLFYVPSALISLVDTKCLWFKSQQGLSASEICRDIRCVHILLHLTTCSLLKIRLMIHALLIIFSSLGRHALVFTLPIAEEQPSKHEQTSLPSAMDTASNAQSFLTLLYI